MDINEDSETGHDIDSDRSEPQFPLMLYDDKKRRQKFEKEAEE